eukprot:s2538_g5.t1
MCSVGLDLGECGTVGVRQRAIKHPSGRVPGLGNCCFCPDHVSKSRASQSGMAVAWYQPFVVSFRH